MSYGVWLKQNPTQKRNLHKQFRVVTLPQRRRVAHMSRAMILQQRVGNYNMLSLHYTSYVQAPRK